MLSVFLLYLIFHGGWAFVTPLINSGGFWHVYGYISTFYDYNKLMLHYELSFLGFLCPMPLEKTTVVAPLDWSQKFPFAI